MPQRAPVADDYATARRAFREAAGRRGARLEAASIGLTGPAGEDLTIDTARLGPADAEALVVVSSGLHGVEGPFGSACQRAWLASAAGRDLPAGVLMLHALSPYGFAYRRRCDERNIDANRNFLLPGDAFRGHPGAYRDLDRLLNPPGPPALADLFWPRALLAIARRGLPALRQAIAEGQYDYPRGLFFGGHGPSRTRGVLEEHLPGWLGPARRVIHLDLHTGIGPRASGALLLDAEAGPEERAWWLATFGPEAVHVATPGFGYRARGGLGTWCRARFAGRAYAFATAEFGTYPALRVLAALRAENRAFLSLPAEAHATRRARARLLEVFAPSDPRWWDSTVPAAARWIDSAIRRLARTLTAGAGPAARTAAPPGEGADRC